jgi:hypothetical protein
MEQNKSVPPYKLLPDTVQTQWATLLHAGKFLANGPGADRSLLPCRKPHVILLYGSSGFCNMNNVELQNRRLKVIRHKMSNVCILNFSLCTNGVQTQFRYWRYQYQYTINIHCSGSVTVWYGSGSSDPYLWLTDPDPALFVRDANKSFF